MQTSDGGKLKEEFKPLCGFCSNHSRRQTIIKIVREKNNTLKHQYTTSALYYALVCTTSALYYALVCLNLGAGVKYLNY